MEWKCQGRAWQVGGWPGGSKVGWVWEVAVDEVTEVKAIETTQGLEGLEWTLALFRVMRKP